MTKTKEILVIGSKMREAIRAAGGMASAELVEALSDRVHELLEAAIVRANSNGRMIVRPCDL
jgi:histone H3/H4